MTKIAWPEMIRAGLGRLRLQPEEFWALTPAELMVMLGQGGGEAPMGQSRLADLLRAYPDTQPAAARADERNEDEQ